MIKGQKNKKVNKLCLTNSLTKTIKFQIKINLISLQETIRIIGHFKTEVAVGLDIIKVAVLTENTIELVLKMRTLLVAETIEEAKKMDTLL